MLGLALTKLRLEAERTDNLRAGRPEYCSTLRSCGVTQREIRTVALQSSSPQFQALNDAIGDLKRTAIVEVVTFGGVSKAQLVLRIPGVGRALETATAATGRFVARHAPGLALRLPGALGGRATGKVLDDVAGDTLSHLSRSQRSSVHSLRQNIAEHQAKLDAYLDDPWAFDNQGHLARNAGNEKVINRIVEGRAEHLRDEIQTWQRQIDNLIGSNNAD